MSTATPDTASITLPTLTPAVETTPKKDPYLIRVPHGATPIVKTAWLLRETLFIGGATLTGFGAMLWVMAIMVNAATERAPHFGDTGLTVIPYGVGAMVSSLVIRAWRNRIQQQNGIDRQALELLIAAIVTVATGFLVEGAAHYAIMVVALFVH